MSMTITPSAVLASAPWETIEMVISEHPLFAYQIFIVGNYVFKPLIYMRHQHFHVRVERWQQLYQLYDLHVLIPLRDEHRAQLLVH